MRTTVRLDDASEPPPAAKSYRVRTFSSKVRPGVDLDSNADLLDVMEQT